MTSRLAGASTVLDYFFDTLWPVKIKSAEFGEAGPDKIVFRIWFDTGQCVEVTASCGSVKGRPRETGERLERSIMAQLEAYQMRMEL